MFCQRIAEAWKGWQQRKYNAGYNNILAEQENLQREQEAGTPSYGIMADYNKLFFNRMQGPAILGFGTKKDFAAERERIEAKKRNLDLMGHAKGLRTALTPQDYMLLDMKKRETADAAIQQHLKSIAEKESREQKVMDGFDEADLMQFDAMKEFEATGAFAPETREQLINAIARKTKAKTDDAKRSLLSELSKKDADALSKKIENIAKSAGTEFNQALRKMAGGSFADIPRLLAAIPAVMAEGWAGKNTDISVKINNEIDEAFNESIDSALLEKAYRSYTPEQMEIGKAKSRNRDYGTRKGAAEDFDG